MSLQKYQFFHNSWLSSSYGRLAAHATALKRIVLFVALCGFVAGLGWSLNSVSEVWSHIRIVPLAALFAAGVPALIALSAAEFRAAVEAGGGYVPWRAALEITVYATAANMLPLPGGALTRLGGMRTHGISVGQGAWIIFLFAGIWAGAAAMLSGAAIAPHYEPLGTGLLAVGIAILAISVTGLRRRSVGLRLIVKIGSIRAGVLAVETVCTMLAVHSLGVKLSLADAATFAVSSVAGAAVSLVPAGLGIREGVVALLSPIISLDPAIGFLSVALSRAVTMASLALLTLLLLAVSNRTVLRSTAPPLNSDEEDAAPLA